MNGCGTMKNWLKKVIKNENGFSLVEAIVTVAILGAAIVPISMVFTRTIETTVETRRQLQANTIAQEYLEHIKSREMIDIPVLMPGDATSGSRTITGGTDLSSIGLETLPDNYNLTISWSLSAELSNIGAIEAGSEPEEPLAVDAIVSIDSGFTTDTVVTIGGGTPNETPDTLDPAQGRVIYIDVARIGASTEGNVIITYRSASGDTVLHTFGSSYTTTEKAIRFYMGNSSGIGSPIDTKIMIDSNIPSEFAVYIYEDAGNTIDADVEVISGLVRISRNLKEAYEVPGRIVEITASVTNNITSETLATFKTTKYDE